MKADSRRIEVLGVEVTPMTPDELRQVIRDAVGSSGRCTIAHHNLHSVYLCQHDERMRRFYASASWIYLDGMPLVWAARAGGRLVRGHHRMTCVDVLPEVAREAEREAWRVFYLGSTPAAVASGGRMLRERFPRLNLELADGYFDPALGNEARIAAINAFRPHVLLVGMGMPRQEHWVLENRDRLEANVVWTVGACLDYFAGVIPVPPRWMGRVGLEWAYRLATEPRRLWRRYLIEPWVGLRLVVPDVVRRVRRRRPS